MDLLDTVRKTLAEQRLISPGDKVVVGVSGGPDSLALLHLLCALRGELRLDLHVAHLNHRLRAAESEADAEAVARLAREWDVPATIESLDVSAWAREQRLGLEEAARIARYRFLSDVARRLDARLIAVAHHADDQVESVVMHFLRGAGLGGLRGMPYATPEFLFLSSRGGEKPSAAAAGEEPRRLIVRPLLDVTRAQIEAYCAAHSLTPRRDRSNEDTTLFRNRLRHEVIPYLETQNPGLRRVLLHTSRALADDYEIVQGEIRKATARVVREEDGFLVFALSPWRALAVALRRGTLRAAVERLRRDLRRRRTGSRAPRERARPLLCRGDCSSGSATMRWWWARQSGSARGRRRSMRRSWNPRSCRSRCRGSSRSRTRSGRSKRSGAGPTPRIGGRPRSISSGAARVASCGVVVRGIAFSRRG